MTKIKTQDTLANRTNLGHNFGKPYKHLNFNRNHFDTQKKLIMHSHFLWDMGQRI